MLGTVNHGVRCLNLISIRWCSQRNLVTPLIRYNELVESGELRQDRHQQSVVTQLDSLCTRLRGYQANGDDAAPGSFFGKVRSHTTGAFHETVL